MPGGIFAILNHLPLGLFLFLVQAGHDVTRIGHLDGKNCKSVEGGGVGEDGATLAKSILEV